MIQGRLAILCSGQAGQRRDMLDALLSDPDMAGLCDLASGILGEEIRGWWRNLPESAIFDNETAQFAIAFYQLAVWMRISTVVPAPFMVAGYSLGELLAYHVSGAVDASETLRLVRHRARCMSEAAGSLDTRGGCMALWRGRTSPSALAARDRLIADNGLDIAIERRSVEQVLSGPANAIDRFLADPAIANADIVRLAVSTPSHSRYLASAGPAFRDVLEKSGLAAPAVPVLAGIDARVVRTAEEAYTALSRQIYMTLQWDRCMRALEEAGITAVIELGPGNDLARLIEMECPRIAARSVEEFRDWRSLPEWLERQG